MNSLAAFERSFRLGYGTETDFRDSAGRLVISHDLPAADSLDAEKVFGLLARHDNRLPLAINIKADGLQGLLESALKCYNIENYFLFDMSVPDAILSARRGLRVFTRHSDVESSPAFYEQAAGVWMDAFQDENWLTPDAVVKHLDAGKRVCLVSPELHQRPRQAFWQRLRQHPVRHNSRLMLCTDVPEEATAYFLT